MAKVRSVRAIVHDGKAYARAPDGTLSPLVDLTDHARLDAMTDEDVTAAAESDPDARPMTDEEWARAPLPPIGKTRVGIRLDTDVLRWFQAEGKGYQSRINAVLRRYVETRRRAG
jgi:uncharacterized protein (DUF4415 family)